MSMSQFCDWVNCFSGERPKELRLGQWAMITLHDHYPDTYNILTGSPRDPFYRDENLPIAMAWILEKYLNKIDL